MYIVYVLKSELHSRYYIGHTSDMDRRIERHNKGYVKSTMPYKPWEVVYIEEYDTKSEAYSREMEIKSYKSGNAFHDLLKY